VPQSSRAASAVDQLKDGNGRFVAGAPEFGPYGPRVAEFADDLRPFAVVLGCSDARVPIEIIFDQNPGKLFVVRVAGNFVNGDNLASIEFGIDVLKAAVVLVLGHTHCGAIRAAVAGELDGSRVRGHIEEIVRAVAPSVRATRDLPGDWVENATAHNVARNVEAIAAGSELIANAAAAGEVGLIGGIYDVTTGRVTFRRQSEA
jgi:carbonic anhydrase